MHLEQAQLRILDFVEVEHFQTGQHVANGGQRRAQPVVGKRDLRLERRIWKLRMGLVMQKLASSFSPQL